MHKFIATNQKNLKILDRGYWVSKLFYFQSMWYWFIYSLKFQSITFFSAINPAVHLGGMLDERKSDIYKLVPKQYLPKTISVSVPSDELAEDIISSRIGFPMIIKPDVGLKGYLVKKVDNANELVESLRDYQGREVLFQEFLTHDREFSLLYYHMPSSGKYGISSFIEKKLPFVIGDGTSSLGQLIDKKFNPFLKKEYILKKKKDEIHTVVAKGEKIIIDHVGNYSRGSKFYSLNHEIDNHLIDAAHHFFSNVKGLNFGRMDFDPSSDVVAALSKGTKFWAHGYQSQFNRGCKKGHLQNHRNKRGEV